MWEIGGKLSEVERGPRTLATIDESDSCVFVIKLLFSSILCFKIS
jgi:hypothetical protein